MTPTERTKILSLINNGLASEDIAAIVGVKRQQVAAIRAHRTMGTYDQTPPRPRENAASSDGKQERTQEGVNELLKLWRKTPPKAQARFRQLITLKDLKGVLK